MIVVNWYLNLTPDEKKENSEKDRTKFQQPTACTKKRILNDSTKPKAVASIFDNTKHPKIGLSMVILAKIISSGGKRR